MSVVLELQKRDLDMIEYLRTFKFSDSKTLQKLFWPNIKATAYYKRMRMLSCCGYIKKVKLHNSRTSYITLNGVEIPEINYYDHEFQLQRAFQELFTAFVQFKEKRFFSEISLSGHSWNSFIKVLLDCKTKIIEPDSIIQTEYGYFAVEVERTQKEYARYLDIFDNYKKFIRKKKLCGVIYYIPKGRDALVESLFNYIRKSKAISTMESLNDFIIISEDRKYKCLTIDGEFENLTEYLDFYIKRR